MVSFTLVLTAVNDTLGDDLSGSLNVQDTPRLESSLGEFDRNRLAYLNLIKLT
jgi:hypothetical protein